MWEELSGNLLSAGRLQKINDCKPENTWAHYIITPYNLTLCDIKLHSVKSLGPVIQNGRRDEQANGRIVCVFSEQANKKSIKITNKRLAPLKHVLPIKHFSPVHPASQAFMHVPVTCSHCDPLLQLPHVSLQLAPNVLLLHSESITFLFNRSANLDS